MEFTVKIKCDNDAFVEDCRGEVGRILRGAANMIQHGAESTGILQDINGNTVGSYKFTKAD